MVVRVADVRRGPDPGEQVLEVGGLATRTLRM